MREAGDVCFADTYKDGTGVVEFLRYDDMKYAIKKLDDSRFRSHEVRQINYILLLKIVIMNFIHFINRVKLRTSEYVKTLAMIVDHHAGN